MMQRALRTYVTASAFVATGFVLGGQAHAQDTAEPTEPPAEAPAAEEPNSPPAEPAAEQAQPDVATQAEAKADADAEVGVKLDGAGSAVAADSTAADASKATPTTTPGRYGNANDWHVDLYGHVRVDAIRDSTESFYDGQQPYLIARAGTYKGQHARFIFTARDTRVGLNLGAPEFGGIRTSGKIEFDFFGIPPTDVKENDQTVFGPVRVRHAFVKLENSIVDVIAGQYYDLFGWGGTFYPATVAFLGVPGQVYHRNPQIRLEKHLNMGGLELTTAIAAVRPGQRDSGIPDGQAGIKLGLDAWSGATTQGFGRTSISPISVGVSGVYRHFEMPVFRSEPGAESMTKTGYGLVASALLPVIPAKKVEDRNNALTLTGEFSIGTGIADMYTGMDGGSRLPLLPNTRAVNPAFIYPQNVDPGLVTVDRTFSLQTIDWQAFVAGLQYYLPIDGGRVWISGVYSQIKSDNIKELTPQGSRGAIFTKMEYIDGSLGIAITPAVSLGLAFETLKQTFGDVSAPTPVFGVSADFNNTDGVTPLPLVANTGGRAANARNNRAQLTLMFAF